MNSIGGTLAFWGSYHRWYEICFKEKRKSNDDYDGSDDSDINGNDGINRGWIKSLVFPCAWTGAWTLVVFAWPLGDYHNYAHVFLGNDEMMQFASFAGLGGLNFILSWGGSVSADLIKKYQENDLIVRIQKPSSPLPSPTPDRYEDHQNCWITTIETPPSKISTSYIPFYQQNIASFTPSNLTRVGCVIKGNGPFDNEDYVNRTIELASNNNKLILWSEITGVLTEQKDLDDLMANIKNISVSYSTIIGFTFLDGIEKDKTYNRLIVVTPSGEVAIDYSKSHLIPMPTTLVKGDNRLQTFESDDFGVIGAAICFDYNFPDLIGPSGIHYSRVNVFRTIENGFSLMRCSRYGVSGVWNSNGQVYNAIPTLSNLTISFDFPFKKRTKTVYGVFGESLGWICLDYEVQIEDAATLIENIANDQR
ncbi:17331_t:CDS:2 [Entrophospora sp. SA101]|nr:17331_t:CDS:2 [Entrophospora sp. SA101]